MRGKWLLISGVVVLAGVAVGALSLRRHEAAPAPPAPVKAAPSVAGEVTLQGKVRARQLVGVGALVGGTIETFLVDVGEEVYEGQVLARISNQGLETGREVAATAAENAQARASKIEASLSAARLEASRAQADAIRARSDLDRNEKAYRRQTMLNAEGATPRVTFEKAVREYENSQAEYQALDSLAKQTEERIDSLVKDLATARKIVEDKHRSLEEAQAALAASEVHSPVNGTVVGRKGEVGKSAQEAGDELFEIATNLLDLRVMVEPTPPILKLIKPGQPALVTIPDFQSEGIPGIVREIKDTQVFVDFTSPNPAIKPGALAEVRIKID